MHNLKEYTILVVDDDEDLREIMTLILKGAGLNVLSANSGIEALEVIKLSKIDLVVSDIRMPNGDGLYLLDKVRENDPKSPVVIFVTGYSDISESEILARGATKLITKPFDRNLLIETVRNALEAL